MPRLIDVLGMDELETSIVFRAATAIVEEKFLWDEEFPTVMGLERDECRILLKSWPDLDSTTENFAFINNSLVNYFGPFHLPDDDMKQLLGIDNDGLAEILGRLRRRAIVAGLEQDNPIPWM